MRKRTTIAGVAAALVVSLMALGSPSIAVVCAPGLFNVSGVVTDDHTGLPLDRVTSVGIMSTDATYNDGEATAPDSTFETCLPAGSYFINFFADGYYTEWWDDSPTPLGATVLVVSSAATGIDAALTPFPVITGRITDARTGDPLFTSVGITDAATGLGLDGIGTDTNGVYRFVVDPNFFPVPGTYKIHFSADFHWSEWYDDAKKKSKAAVITVNRDSGVIGGLDEELRHCGRPVPDFCVPRNFNR